MKRWLRRTLRRWKINLPFGAVICPCFAKKILVRSDGSDVTVSRALVFLDVPEAGDLHDIIPISNEAEGVIRLSSDMKEVSRKPGRGGTLVSWVPRDPIVPYALYTFEHGWTSSESRPEAALYTELRSDARTGILELEIATPEPFEAAVAFKRPRWLPPSQQGLVKYALRQLEHDGNKPALVENGCRLGWKVEGPRVGERYVCVAFYKGGVELWQRRLEAGSLLARMRGVLRPLVSG